MQNSRPPLVSVSAAILALLGGATSSGLLPGEGVAQAAPGGKRDEDGTNVDDTLLLISPRDEAPILLAHSSHASHASHSSGNGSGYQGDPAGPGPATPAPYTPPPAPAKPGVVSIAAYPGGQIFVDGKPVGHDESTPVVLTPGSHQIRVENRFVGTGNETVQITEGQTGKIEVEW